MFKKILLSIVSLVFTLNCFAADTMDMSNPYVLANAVATKTVSDIKANKDKISDKSVAMDIIERDLIPYIDIKYAAYKVIGTSLKSTSAQDREKFTKAFATYMQKNLIGVLSKYTNQDIVPAAVPAGEIKDKLVSVKLYIREEGKKDLELILKLRKNEKTGEWKAFDLIGENISMLDAKISELSPIIKSSGIDAAIAKLQEIEQKK